MIASGHLAARRTGRQWLIERSALPVVPDPTVGRPLSARSCWAILATLQGDAPEGFSRSELARARQRAGEILAAGIRPGTLAGRAAEHPRYASPAGLGGLLDDDRIVRSGEIGRAHV